MTQFRWPCNPDGISWGVSLMSGSTRLAEMAGRIGFDAVWIEMEHGPTDFAAAEMLCMAIESGGAVPAIRLPDGQRHHVLRAVEINARIVIVPMINTAAAARDVVRHGKFPPLGERGFNSRTRGTGYGLRGFETEFAEANASNHLLVQIETREAIENLEEICGVAGISGILVGPSDLSMSYGLPGQTSHPDVIHVVTKALCHAHEVGLRTAIVASGGPLLEAAINAKCDLIFCGNDVSNLGAAWTELRKGCGGLGL